VKKKYTTTADIHVHPRKGFTIDDWMNANHKDLSSRETTYRGPVVGLPGVHLVTVTYTAHGADSSDLMQPYREAKKWRHMADVMPTGRRNRVSA